MLSYISHVTFLYFILLKRGECRQFELNPGLPQRIIIPSNETSSIYIENIPSNILFAVVQLHTQRYNLSISTAPTFYRNATKTGTNVGMTTLIIQGKTQLTWYVQTTAFHNLTAVSYIQLYMESDPVPGGCNQVFSLAIDPSIVVTVGTHSTQVWFQWSNLANPQGQALPDCENKTVMNTLSYDVYVSFVQQRDFSEESYLKSIEAMLSPDNIIDNGVNVFSVKDSPSSKSQVMVTSETNQGALYAVIVTRHDTSRRAAYVTAVTYACDFEKDSCSSKSSAMEIVFAVILCCCGLFLLVLGHGYFKSMLFLFALTFISLLTYILLSVTCTLNDSVKIPVSAALGVVGGCIWVAYWYFCAFPIISVLVPGMCAGYLVASVLFFSPLGNIWWWDTSLNYAIAFVCVVLFFTVILMAYQKVLSIISCGIVGAFMFLMSMVIPLRSSLRLIFLNSLYHQTEEGYVTVKVVAPFQPQDITFAVLWPVLIIAGVAFQFYRGRNQPSFEIPPRHRRLTAHAQVPHRFSDTEEGNIVNNETDDERASLLPRDADNNTRIPETYQTFPSTESLHSGRDRERNLLA